MSLRKKPEKAVPVLLARLTKAKDNVLRVHSDHLKADELSSTFQDIESKLKIMTDSLSRIKNWEKEVVEQFCALEQALDDDIFSFKDPKLPPDEVPKKLAQIKGDVEKLNGLISTDEQSVNLKIVEKKPQNLLADVGRQTIVVTEEWAAFGPQVEDKIMESKALSSLYASFLNRFQCPKLRMCLICLSVFPENTPIKKRPLIYWWMGEGLVTSTRDGATAEDAGERVFQELLNEGIIRPTASTSTSTSSFKICPWVRRVLIRLAKENRFLNFSDPQCMPRSGKRRVFLWRGKGNNNEAMGDGDKEEELLTVFNMNEQYLGTKPEWLLNLHKLEVLQMGRWQDSDTHHIEAEKYEELLFKGLGSQKHLKYLSLRGISRIETLPPTIRKLVSLQILDLRACHNLEKLPPTISELRNLTHLDVSECYLLETMPKGLERLSYLQVFKGFVVGSSGSGSCKIADLARLRNLRKLSVRVHSNSRDQLGGLVNLLALRILTISWMGVVASETPAQLPEKLTKLDLRSVPFQAVPDWLHPSQLPDLEKLYIKGGHLNTLNEHKYQSVKFSRLQYLTGLKIKQKELEALFPNYLYLEKTNCHKDDPNVMLPELKAPPPPPLHRHLSSSAIPHPKSENKSSIS